MPRLSLRKRSKAEPAREPEAPTANFAASPVEAPAPPRAEGYLDRGRMRRRLRYLRRVRELALRDLGGLVFELHHRDRARDDLVKAKLGTLTAIHREIGTLEDALGDPQSVIVLREAGLGACAQCGVLHGSDAHYCPNCGRPVGRTRLERPRSTSLRSDSTEGSA
ncbi:MAG TPA: hypothetical protein VHX88_09095 [Solirubrobacteraceae bacterium]|jgi:hypothetical protein|nr:hypothetical protein [Solirubrobacteraceae bacterium]